MAASDRKGMMCSVYAERPDLVILKHPPMSVCASKSLALHDRRRGIDEMRWKEGRTYVTRCLQSFQRPYPD